MWRVDDSYNDPMIVNEIELRKLARINKIIDWDIMPIDDISDCLMECFEELEVSRV